MKKLPKKDSINRLILYVVFPIIQLVMWLLICIEISSTSALRFPVFLFLLLITAVLIILLYQMFRERNAKKKLQSSFQELNQLRTLEEQHYQQIQVQREELEKLKYEFSDKLASILDSLKRQDIDSARIQMDTLTTQLAATREYPYCNNPIINAVLTEKKCLCEEKNISLSVQIPFCRFEAVNNLHLCSIFSNLTDNAIHACEALPEHSSRFIRITAGEFGDYLILKFVNSSLPAKKSRPAPGHGYGQKIVRDIASQYHGSFDTSYSNNQYTVTLSLLLPKKPVEAY